MRKFMFRCAGFTHRMIEEVDGYLFECSSPAGECSHWLSPDQYKRFLASIGQRPSNNLFPAVIASIRERGNKTTVVGNTRHRHLGIRAAKRWRTAPRINV